MQVKLQSNVNSHDSKYACAFVHTNELGALLVAL